MDIKNLSIKELEELMEKAKVRIKEIKKDKQEENRNRLIGVEEGKEVVVIFKGKEVKANFVAITNSRFTVEINGAKKSIMFDKLVKVL